MQTLEEKIHQLAPESQQEVERFIEFIVQKETLKKPGKKLRQDWAGALKEYRNQYTSLELQKKSLEWRGE
ncbi:MAG: DUF2281 domain-containing protein [Ignavibacteriales bacterium]|nr:DUF2281 domain-containing protein [Ignavibacteriales bacterium]